MYSSQDDVSSSIFDTPSSILSSMKSLEQYSHIFDTPPKIENDVKLRASPPVFSNIVLKTCHNSDLNLNVLFNILPIVNIYPKQIEKSEKEFKTMFISVRNYPKNRGYRGKSNIKSFLDLDYYFEKKVYHLKISKNNITIVGGKSFQASEKMIRSIYSNFIEMNTEWLKYSQFSKDERNRIMKLYEEEIIPDEDDLLYNFYKYLDIIIDRNEENVKERLCDIYPLLDTPLYSTEPLFRNLVNCNLVYNYRLPKEILLKDKAKELEKLGYEVSYDNVIFVKQLMAKWKDDEHNDSFNLTVQTIGSIKQNTSSTHERSLEMYEKMVTDLGFLPYKEGCEYALKKSPTKFIVEKESETTKKIIDSFLCLEKNITN